MIFLVKWFLHEIKYSSVIPIEGKKLLPLLSLDLILYCSLRKLFC